MLYRIRLLLDFLNELLKEEQGRITEITYLKNEHLDQDLNRKAIFDLYRAYEGKEPDFDHSH